MAITPACSRFRRPATAERLRHQRDRTVVVAVISVRVMQSPINYVAGMVAMWNCFVAASRAVDMPIFVAHVVGLVATIVSLVIGIAWGATAGYLGGRTDQIMMRIVDVLYAMPFMFFVIILMVIFRTLDLMACISRPKANPNL